MAESEREQGRRKRKLRVNLGASDRNEYKLCRIKKLHKAYDLVLKKGYSVYKAAKLQGIPEQTLRDRVNGRVAIDASASRPTIISAEMETELANFAIRQSELGYTFTRSEFMMFASEMAHYARETENKFMLTKTWFYSFLKRNSQLKHCKQFPFRSSRTKKLSPEGLQMCFTELGALMDLYGLKEKPHLIYTMDELILSSEATPAVGFPVPVISFTSSEYTTLTVIGSANAQGIKIPPYFIFKSKKMSNRYLDNCLPGSQGTVSATGWPSSAIFQRYLRDHLSIHVLKERGEEDTPILLLYNAQKSLYIIPQIIDWARESGIIMFVFPRHPQSQNFGCLEPLKSLFFQQYEKFLYQNAGTDITRGVISELVSTCYNRALSFQHLETAFTRSGIYPFDTDVAAKMMKFRRRRELTTSRPRSSPRKRKRRKPAPKVKKESSDESDRDIYLSSDPGSSTPISDSDENVNLATGLHSDQYAEHQLEEVSGISIDDSQFQMGLVEEVAMDESEIDMCMLTGVINDFTGEVSSEVVEIMTEEASGTNTDDQDVVIVEGNCCMCNQFTPPALLNCATIAVVNWAQCDNLACQHWCHLTYCTDISIVKRSSVFYCPHCESAVNSSLLLSDQQLEYTLIG